MTSSGLVAYSEFIKGSETAQETNRQRGSTSSESVSNKDQLNIPEKDVPSQTGKHDSTKIDDDQKTETFLSQDYPDIENQPPSVTVSRIKFVLETLRNVFFANRCLIIAIGSL